MIIDNYDNLNLENTAIALGKFEGIHKGHQILLQKARELADEEGLSAAVFSINMIGRHINVSYERVDLFEKLGIDVIANCDFTKEFANIEPEQFVKQILVEKLGAKYVIVGEDFRFGKDRAGDAKFLSECMESIGGKAIIIPQLSIDDRKVSSTAIRGMLRGGEIKEANYFLGYCYHITGECITGRQLGRTIDFPTINIKADPNKYLPVSGAYISHIIVDGITYRSITNVGSNPTVTDSPDIFVETHVLDFNKDMYGKTVTVYFDDFLRLEQRFSSVEKLKEQLERDCKRAREF